MLQVEFPRVLRATRLAVVQASSVLMGTYNRASNCRLDLRPEVWNRHPPGLRPESKLGATAVGPAGASGFFSANSHPDSKADWFQDRQQVPVQEPEADTQRERFGD